MEVKKTILNTMLNDTILMGLITDVYYKIAPQDAQTPFVAYDIDTTADEQLYIKQVGKMLVSIIDYDESAERAETIKERIIELFDRKTWKNNSEYIVLKTYYTSESTVIEDDEKVQHIDIAFDVIWYKII